MAKGSSFPYHTADGRRCPHSDPHDGRRWMYSVRIGDRNHTRRGFATKREADAALAELLASVVREEYVAPSAETLAGWAEQWLTSIARSVEPTTLANYRWYMTKHVLPTLGRTRLDKLTPEMLEGLYADMEARGLSRSTVRSAHGILRNALNGAVQRKRLRHNPALVAEAGKRRKFRPQVWGASELAVFLAGIRGHRLEALFTLLATSGMRRGEALGLRWDDLDWDTRLVHVDRSHVLVAGRLHEKDSTKTDRGRFIDLDEETLGVLRDWQLSQLAEFAALGATPRGDTLIFTDETGQPLRPETVGKAFRTVVTDLGLKRIRLHDLRHTHATLLLSNGVPVKVVQERLGHASPAVTMEVYAHVLPQQGADAASLFRQLLQNDFSPTH